MGLLLLLLYNLVNNFRMVVTDLVAINCRFNAPISKRLTTKMKKFITFY